MKITDTIKYIGVNDKTLDLFESQYKVPNGISYNSYLIKDEKIVIMDTVDERMSDQWFHNLEIELQESKPDYLVISHLEPDHSGNIEKLAKKYPSMKLIGNMQTFHLLPQFFDIPNWEERKILVKEGDSVSIGLHTLTFYMAPMVHWPEVMVTYEEREKVLFSADAFGKFGTLDIEEDWISEARRYYFGIVGKYGVQVQALLKKLVNIEIHTICPLHGPILRENLAYYIHLYDLWSHYLPEDEGVLIACASIHGNTLKIAQQIRHKLIQENKTVVLSDLTRDDMSKAIENAFRYNKVILLASSYNAGVFPPMESFLNELKGRNYQNRMMAIIENGTWAPSAAKEMKYTIEGMKNIDLYENIITIRTRASRENWNEIDKLIKKW